MLVPVHVHCHTREIIGYGALVCTPKLPPSDVKGYSKPKPHCHKYVLL